MDLQREVAVRQPLHPDRVIEIARGLAVDRDNVEMRENRAARDLRRADLVWNVPRLLHHVRRKLVRQMVLADDDLDVDAEIVRIAEHLDDSPDAGFAVFAETPGSRR